MLKKATVIGLFTVILIITSGFFCACSGRVNPGNMNTKEPDKPDISRGTSKDALNEAEKKLATGLLQMANEKYLTEMKMQGQIKEFENALGFTYILNLKKIPIYIV